MRCLPFNNRRRGEWAEDRAGRTLPATSFGPAATKSRAARATPPLGNFRHYTVHYRNIRVHSRQNLFR